MWKQNINSQNNNSKKNPALLYQSPTLSLWYGLSGLGSDWSAPYFAEGCSKKNEAKGAGAGYLNVGWVFFLWGWSVCGQQQQRWVRTLYRYIRSDGKNISANTPNHRDYTTKVMVCCWKGRGGQESVQRWHYIHFDWTVAVRYISLLNAGISDDECWTGVWIRFMDETDEMGFGEKR